MKRFGIRHIYMLVVFGLHFLFVNNAFSQQQANLFASENNLDQVVREAILAARAARQTLQADSEIPPPDMWDEPFVTATDSNVVYWTPFPEEVPIGADRFVPSLVEIEVSLDSFFTDILIWDFSKKREDNFVVLRNLPVGDTLYYRTAVWGERFLASGGSKIVNSEWSRTIFSIQDSSAPVLQVDTLTIVPGPNNKGRHGWITTSSFAVEYKQLIDRPAGLRTAFLTGDLIAEDIFFDDPSNDQQAPDSIDSGGFSFSGKSDGIYNFDFGAEDAAYSPEQRSKDVFTFQGNVDSSLAQGEVKIDTKPPTIDLSNLFDSYYPNRPHIKFTITDTLSGVDPNSIVIEFTPTLPISIPPDSIKKVISGNTCYVLVNIPNLVANVTSTMSVTAADSAGNKTSQSSKAIDFLFQAKELTTYRIIDLDFESGICFEPNFGFTNSDTVYIDSFSFFENKVSDLLLIIGENDSVTVPYESRIKFDIQQVTYNITNGKTLDLTVKALDTLGNKQHPGLEKSIVFDSFISDITITAKDSTPIEDDERHGAESGWTNDKQVLVQINSPDNDLSKMQEIKPDQDCLQFLPEFYYKTTETTMIFQYQVSDKAGNASNVASDTIHVLYTVYQPDSTDFKVLDRTTLREECTNDDSVYVVFKPKTTVENLSRIVVNDSVFFAGANDTLTVPNDSNGIFKLSIVDFAGNESDTTTKNLQDTTPPIIDTSLVKPVYTSKDIDDSTHAIPTIPITFGLRDLCSGIDTTSIVAQLDSAVEIARELVWLDDSLRVTVWFGDYPDTNFIDTLRIIASDSKGNAGTEKKGIRFQLKAPEVLDFCIRDLDYDANICLAPDATHTNSTTVHFDSFTFAGNVAPDFLIITGIAGKDTIPYSPPPIKFDLDSVQTEFISGNPVCITINGMDADGNAQTDGPDSCIIYDDERPSITLSVADPTSWEADPAHAAYSGYTNDDSVHVVITPTDPDDIFKIEQTAPTEGCEDTTWLDYFYHFSDFNNGVKRFEYQAGDFAGNTSNRASAQIKLDTFIAPISREDFSLSYVTPPCEDTTNTDPVLIKITYLNPDDAIPDLSRIIVHKSPDSLHFMDGNRYATAPMQVLDYIVSVVDSAGNESNWINLPFDKVPPGIDSLFLSDITPPPFHADSGYTNSTVVNLELYASDAGGSGLDSLLIWGDVAHVQIDSTSWQELPGKLVYHDNLRIRLREPEGAIDTLQVKCRIYDGAQNCSQVDSIAIIYIEQHVTARIDTSDTLGLSSNRLPADKKILLPVCYTMNFPQYAWKFVTGDRSFSPAFLDSTMIEAANPQASESCCDTVRFHVADEEKRYVFVLDKAGNKSALDSIYVDILEPPVVSFTLYDPLEFDLQDLERSDSEFASEGSDSVVALTTLVDGDWNSIRYAYKEEHLKKKDPESVDNPDGAVDFCLFPIPSDIIGRDTTVVLTLWVQVKNTADDSFTISDDIIYDSRPPEFTIDQLANAPIVADSIDFQIIFSGSDQPPGELAAMVVTDYYEGSEQGNSKIHIVEFTTSPPMAKINLWPKIGLHRLKAFLVDKAGIDQNNLDEVLEALQKGDLSGIRHPSRVQYLDVRLNPFEVANFPNPFDPNKELTKFVLPVNSDSGSRVKFTILDPFGNLVNEWETYCERRFNIGAADRDQGLTWNGLNANGDMVANGGYICIIDALDTGERHIRKIAVIKK